MTDQARALILIRQNDGRLEPLESDRISRALFAATEAQGNADAFLARELADAIVSALASETQLPLTIHELVDSITKYVRELGHPALARLYREQTRFLDKHDDASNRPTGLRQLVDNCASPREVRRQLAKPALRDLAMSEVYPRDVASMVRDGLMQIQGLEFPCEFAASVLREGMATTTARLGIPSALESAARYTGDYVVVDGPEHGLATFEGEPQRAAVRFVGEWQRALDEMGFSGAIHVNIPAAPAWASDPQSGPLFGGRSRPTSAGRVAEFAFAIGAQATRTAPISWHISRAEIGDIPSPPLVRLIESVRDLQAIEFVLDRAKEPVSLGPGFDRNGSPVLLFVGIHLARLAEQISPCTPERFLEKLGSLARLARSAGHAKLDFLRRHGRAELKREFLLERARLVVTPIGIEEAVRIVVERPACDLGPGTQFAQSIVSQLMNALTREPPRNMEVVLDSLPAHLGFGFATQLPARRDVAGLSVWDGDAPPRQQLRASGELHAAARAGTAALLMPNEPASAEEILQLLKHAAQHDVRRVRFMRSDAD